MSHENIIVSVPDRIREFCKANLADVYHPFDSQSVFRMVGSFFGRIPFVRTFENLNVDSLYKVIQKFSFDELIREDIFNKDDKQYIKGINGFINYDKHIFLRLSLQENAIDNILNRDSDSPSINEIIDGYHDNNNHDDSTEIYITDLIIYYDNVLENNTLDKQWLEDLFKEIERIALEDIKIKVKKNSINFLCFDQGFHLKNVKIKRPFKGDLESNYGTDFLKVNDHLIKFLDSDKTGLAILHGEIGSGKTFYIRYLLSILNKKVIYIPPHLVNRVAEPDFLSFLLRQNDFVLVIEDAEEIIMHRKDTNNTAGVSNLLNLSDGILGDCICVKIVVTFNSQISNIDPALLRKGRLKIEHEFKKLNPAQANKLFKHLGIDYETKESMSLSDIYGYNTNNFRKEKERVRVGFGK